MQDISQMYDYVFKVVVVGQPGVGKTAMLYRCIQDIFYDEHLTTIGVDFKLKTLKIDGKTIKLNIWDTAGQERFGAVVENYYRGSKGVLVVYSIADRKSFEKLTQWLERIRPHVIPKIIVVGNKCDLEEEQRVVSRKEAETLCKTYSEDNDLDVEYIETSAFTGERIAETFETLAKSLVQKMDELKLKNVDTLDTRDVFTLEGVDPFAPKEEPVLDKKCC